MVDHQHWLDRWKEDRIGFHQGSVNPHLQKWFPRLAPPPGSTLFLPLCGKALDILWCAQQGYEVIGIELSQIAVEAFFSENSLDYERSEDDRFTRYRAPNITLLQGDFFDLSAEDLQACGLVYDRAALIALTAGDRPRYYAHMLSVLPPQCAMLLIAIEYDQAEMQGPPFSVPSDEIAHYYREAYDIKTLDSLSIIDEQPRWRKVGLTALQESVFALTRK